MFLSSLVIIIRTVVKLKIVRRVYLFHKRIEVTEGNHIMREMDFKPLTDKDRQRNEYLDKMNHAPYPTIVLMAMGICLLFTLSVLLGSF